MSYFVKTAAVAFGLFWLAGAASAQNVSQSQLVDEAGSGAYPVTIIGSNGLTYRCRRDLVVVDGKRVRYCVAALRGGLAPNAGMGVAAALALGLVAVAASDDS